jgi:hypothetical protein
MADLRRPLTNPDAWDGYGWGWWTYPMWEAGELRSGDNASYAVPVKVEHNGSHATYSSSMLLLPEEKLGVVVLMNLNDEIASSRFYQMQNGIAMILLGREAPVLTSTDEFLSQNGRLVGLAWVALLVAFVAWSVRRYRRWRRDPETTPRGALPILWRMIVPLMIVVTQLAGFWVLLTSQGAATSLSDVPRLVRLSPDVGLVIVSVMVVSVAWIVIGTIWTIRLLRGGASADPSVRTAPGAP